MFTYYLGLAALLHGILFLLFSTIDSSPELPPMPQTFSVHIPIQSAPIGEKTTSVKKKSTPTPKPKTYSPPVKERPDIVGPQQLQKKGQPDQALTSNAMRPTRPDNSARASATPPPAQQDASAEHLLKNLADQDTMDEESDKKVMETTADPIHDIADQLTISELDAFKQQLARCWVLPINAAQNIPVHLAVSMNTDGTVANVNVMEPTPPFSPDVTVAVNNATHTFNHPDCYTLNLPKERYQQWKKFRIIFHHTQGELS